jgi:hypothetical protein
MFVDELTSNHKREISAYLHPYVFFSCRKIQDYNLEFIMFKKPLIKIDFEDQGCERVANIFLTFSTHEIV